MRLFPLPRSAINDNEQEDTHSGNLRGSSGAPSIPFLSALHPIAPSRHTNSPSALRGRAKQTFEATAPSLAASPPRRTWCLLSSPELKHLDSVFAVLLDSFPSFSRHLPCPLEGFAPLPRCFINLPRPLSHLRSRSNHSARIASLVSVSFQPHIFLRRERFNTAHKSLQKIAYAGQDEWWFRVRKRPRVHAAGAEAASQAISQKVENRLPAMQSAPRQGEPLENSMNNNKKKKRNTTCQLNQAKTPCV